MKTLIPTLKATALALALTAMNSFATLVAVPRVDSDWGSGLTGAVVLKNTGSTPVSDWSATVSMPGAISSIWNASVISKNGNTVEVSHVGWNSTVPAGSQVEFGFVANPGGFSANQISVTPGGQATSPEPSPAPSPTPPSDPIPAPTVPAGSPNVDVTQNGLRMEFRVVSDWGGGLTASVKLINTTSAPIANWIAAMDLATNPSGPWDASHSRSGIRSEFRPVAWNSVIPAGGSVSFGFNASPGNLTEPPAKVVLFGSQSSVPAAQTTPAPTPQPTPAPIPVPSPTPAPSTSTTTLPLPGDSSNPPALKDTKIVGYFVEWGIYGRNYNVTDIPADKLNVINYAFANISPQGEVAIYDSWAAIEKAFPGDSWEKMPRGNFNQLAKLKEKYPHLITMISVGGWTLSSRFSDVALTPQSRARFAKSAVDFIIQHGFDGVDIDWEYPVGGGLESNVYRPEDKRNYTLLLRELRSQLDARSALDSRKYYLTIAAPAGDDKIRNIEPVGIAEACDWVNVMTYDFAGGWDKRTGHQAPMFSPEGRGAANPSTLWSVDGAVRQFLATGVDPKKLVVGVPFYGRGWSGVPLTNSGIGQLSTGLPRGSYEPGVFDYKDLVTRIQSNPDLYEVFEDTKAEASFLFAPGDNGLWVSFDDTAIVQRKVDYIKELGLGGAMFWELSGDTKDSSTSLLNVLHKGLGK